MLNETGYLQSDRMGPFHGTCCFVGSYTGARVAFTSSRPPSSLLPLALELGVAFCIQESDFLKSTLQLLHKAYCRHACKRIAHAWQPCLPLTKRPSLLDRQCQGAVLSGTKCASVLFAKTGPAGWMPSFSEACAKLANAFPAARFTRIKDKYAATLIMSPEGDATCCDGVHATASPSAKATCSGSCSRCPERQPGQRSCSSACA